MRAFWCCGPRLPGAAAEMLRIIASAPRAATRMHGIPAAEHQNGALPCRRGTITGAFAATGPSARTPAHQNARILVPRAPFPRCRGRNAAHYCADVERGHQNARDPCRRTPEWRPALPARHHNGRIHCHGSIGGPGSYCMLFAASLVLGASGRVPPGAVATGNGLSPVVGGAVQSGSCGESASAWCVTMNRLFCLLRKD